MPITTAPRYVSRELFTLLMDLISNESISIEMIERLSGTVYTVDTYADFPTIMEGICLGRTLDTNAYYSYNTGTGIWDPIGGGGLDLGWYVDLAALQAAHPTGVDGNFAVLGSTDTVWVWDSNTNAWVDTLHGAAVASVTDDGNTYVTVDNTDPANPVIGFAGVNVDGVTITGTGTTGDPLVGAPAGVLSVSGANVDNTDPVNPVIDNIVVDGVTITGTGISGDPLVSPADGVQSVTGWNVGGTATDPTIAGPVVDGTTITGTGVIGDPLVATAASEDHLVVADALDTTAGYLDNKINIHSSDASVSVTHTITNPSGDEVIDIDLTVTIPIPHYSSYIVTSKFVVGDTIDLATGLGVLPSTGAATIGGDLVPLTLNASKVLFEADNTALCKKDGAGDFVEKGTVASGFRYEWVSSTTLKLGADFDVTDTLGVLRVY